MRTRPRRPADESGFTLIEVLISIIVLGFIASGVAAAIILFFKTADGTTSRLALSHDSQLLATYLIPDLDSLSGVAPGQPLVTSPPGLSPPPCQIPGQSGVSFGQPGFGLQIPFTDLSFPPHGYLADYTVSGPVMTRTFYVDGVKQSTTEVVHNLYSPDTACFSTPGWKAPWTMTVTTATPGPGVDCAKNPVDCYTFSVTGGGRVATPPPSKPPALCSTCLVSLDTNGDGKIDEIVATFDQPLNPNDTAGIAQWTLVSGTQPDVTLKSVSVLGNTATLSLNEGSQLDTVANGFTVALAAFPNGIRNGINQPAWFVATPVTDGMAPVLASPTSIVSQDTNGDGKMNRIVVTFSENLDPAYSAKIAPWTLSGAPTGVSLNSVSVSGPTAILTLNEGPAVDTTPTPGFTVTLNADPAGIRDLNGNQSSFPATSVTDGMAPAPISLVSKDIDHNGKVDEVVVTFSESLVSSTYTTPWRLSGLPHNATLNSVDVSRKTATLHLNEGDTFDTAATALKVALAANPPGVQSLMTPRRVSFFDLKSVSDGMSPVVVGMVSTNATGGTLYKLEPKDTLTLTFSEPLAPASVPTNPTLTLIPGGNNTDDMLTISGTAPSGVSGVVVTFVTIDLGAKNAYVMNLGATFNTSLTSTTLRNPDGTLAGVLKITVGTNTSGAGNVLTATTDTIMNVTPSAITDVAANAVAGTFTSIKMRLF